MKDSCLVRELENGKILYPLAREGWNWEGRRVTALNKSKRSLQLKTQSTNHLSMECGANESQFSWTLKVIRRGKMSKGDCLSNN